MTVSATRGVSSAVPSVSFFVLFSKNDAVLAKYTLRSLRKLGELDFAWDATVYLNGLSEADERTVSRYARRVGNVIVKSNRQQAAEWKPDFPLGGFVKRDDYGLVEMRYTPCETGAEVWTRELPKLAGTYVCQIDGDFELLQSTLLTDMKRALDGDSKLSVISATRHDDVRYLDSYSGQQCVSAARADTWCAMWRRDCITDPPGFWYREAIGANGEAMKFDHGAYLQYTLAQRGWRTAGVNDFATRTGATLVDGIHYGAFALNQSLHGIRLCLYRFCRIAVHNGYIHRHASRRLATAIRGLGSRLYLRLGFAASDDERTRYWWQEGDSSTASSKTGQGSRGQAG
jgi:hypothetical protein